MKHFARVPKLIAFLMSRSLDINVPLFLLKTAYYHVLLKHIYAHHNTSIKGIRHIDTRGHLFVGAQEVGFLNRHDRTFLNIRGKLVIEGDVWVGKGCRIAVNRGAVCTLKQCGLTGQTTLIVAHGLEIGKGSVVSWGCELGDEDFHSIEYDGKVERDHAIVVGDHVWIGSHVKILKGVHIGDNSVIAANSVVTRSFVENNVLIAGNPAEIIKRGVEWHA